METRQDVQAEVPATLDELITAARQRMEEAGYSPSTRSRYGDVWLAVKRFALRVEKTNHFSVDLIERYLAHLSPRKMLSGCSERWPKPHRSKSGGREQGGGGRLSGPFRRPGANRP